MTCSALPECLLVVAGAELETVWYEFQSSPMLAFNMCDFFSNYVRNIHLKIQKSLRSHIGGLLAGFPSLSIPKGPEAALPSAYGSHTWPRLSSSSLGRRGQGRAGLVLVPQQGISDTQMTVSKTSRPYVFPAVPSHLSMGSRVGPRPSTGCCGSLTLGGSQNDTPAAHWNVTVSASFL